ncbi:MAG TPA: HD domain-containing phosphohydrolase [Alicycliphilus sp.]|nr:HD domain-containing phosphohydrolase [Alicycliphilus sp.]
MNVFETSLAASAADAAAGPGDNRHYLRALTDMADRGNVLTHAAIYTDRGIKLVDKGTRVDSQLYDRLVKHKLRGNIEDLLSVENMVSVQSLVQLAREQCANDTLAYLLVHTLPDMTESKLLAPVRAMPLPPAMAFKLTVMREQHPQLFAHSVRMMLVAVYLGIKSDLSERECTPLAAAALLHDLGVLHMDPAWHDPANKITGAGRKQLLAHPVTAMLIIREQNIYPRSVEQAVLEHHECMDGSGYPRRLQGGQISRLGQILLTAEVVAAFFEKYANQGAAQRLSLILKLNHRRFPADLVACLLPLLQIRAVQGDVQATQDDVQRCIAQLTGAFEDWERCRAIVQPAAAQTAPEPACTVVGQRLAALQKSLFESGSHPRQLAEMLPHLQGDAQGLAELALLGQEALWQLQRIVDTTHSHWPQLPGSEDAGDIAVVQWRDACTARLAQEPAAT